MRVLLLSAGALTGFAANSLLTRGALATGTIEPAPFALIRILAGALMLALLVRARPATSRLSSGPERWWGALALAGYLVAFTAAYERIGASAGALMLFGSAQFTMIAAGVARGERAPLKDSIGALVALAGLVWLTLPGVTAPDLIGAALMAAAGACWGGYSIAGRNSRDPLADTARNFGRASLLVVVPLGIASVPFDASLRGVLLAACSGALASGVAYSLWYAALPSLSAWRAATIQLAVPVVIVIAAWLLLGEALTPRLAVSAACIAAGVLLTTGVRPRGQT